MTIIDIDMPRNCFECKLKFRGICPKLIKNVQGLRKERLEDCPLKESEVITKKEYEKSLKADMMAMLKEIQSEIEKLSTPPAYQDEDYFLIGTNRCRAIIQQKIEKYKKESEDE